MNALLLNKSTAISAKAFINRPSHALLISGGMGSGKSSLARVIALSLLGLETPQQLENYPYFTTIKRPEGKQDIPIDSIRALNKQLKLKAPGEREIRRVVLIEDAQDLNDEAANALLKMLEEPAPESVFILSTTSPHNLLPTISSRAQQLQIKPVSADQSLKFLQSKYSQTQIESARQLSQGNVGLMLAILQDDSDHPLKQAIDEAKDYLRKDSYQRTLLADKLGRDKNQLALLLEALLKLLGAVQHSAIRAGNDSKQKKLLASRKLVLKLQKALEANTSPKLIALELSLNLL